MRARSWWDCKCTKVTWSSIFQEYNKILHVQTQIKQYLLAQCSLPRLIIGRMNIKVRGNQTENDQNYYIIWYMLLIFMNDGGNHEKVFAGKFPANSDYKSIFFGHCARCLLRNVIISHFRLHRCILYKKTKSIYIFFDNFWGTFNRLKFERSLNAGPTSGVKGPPTCSFSLTRPHLPASTTSFCLWYFGLQWAKMGENIFTTTYLRPTYNRRKYVGKHTFTTVVKMFCQHIYDHLQRAYQYW